MLKVSFKYQPLSWVGREEILLSVLLHRPCQSIIICYANWWAWLSQIFSYPAFPLSQCTFTNIPFTSFVLAHHGRIFGWNPWTRITQWNKRTEKKKKKYFHIEVHSPVQLELQLTVTTLTNKLILFHRVFISSTSQFSLHSWQLLQWT